MNRFPGGMGLHLLGALGLAGWAVLSFCSNSSDALLPVFAWVTAGQWLIFLTSWCYLSRTRSARLPGPILAWAVAFRLCGVLSQPVMEDDHYRFLWDGRQFALTGNPYATTPASHFADANLPDRFAEILDQVNYPSVPTIYGPICQVVFLLSYLVSPGSLWPVKSILLFADLALLAIGVGLARQLSGTLPSPPPAAKSADAGRAALILGWCPLLIFETSFNAHPEILGVALLTTAMWFHSRNAVLWCAVLCGLAAAAKIVALLLVPFLIGRSLRGWATFALTLAAPYALFWAQGSIADLGGLMAFARQWEFNSSIHAILRAVAGPDAARSICAAAFGGFWLWLFGHWVRQNHGAGTGWNPPPGAAVFGMFLLLSATVNPWYLLWLAPFTALRPGATALSAMALVSLSYATGLNLQDPSLGNFEHPAWVRPVEYGGIALAAAAHGWFRRHARLAGR